MQYTEIPSPAFDNITISNFYKEKDREKLVEEIWTGLASLQKYIAPKFFYDDRGSALFEEITQLLEYYPARTEKKILQEIAPRFFDRQEPLDIVELGSGDPSKISILLDAVAAGNLENITYIPVDVSQSAILQSSEWLSRKYTRIKIHGLLADFAEHLEALPHNKNKQLICFFGGTFGNLSPGQAQTFLNKLKTRLRPGDTFLLGLDRVKNSRIIENAYNDSKAITAAFNQNILHVMNRIARTNFDPRLFQHLAFYNAEKARIEMHLKALADMTITSPLFPTSIGLYSGETIHTENSHKFTYDHVIGLGRSTGLKVRNIFSDEKEYFSVVRFEMHEKI